MVKPTTQTIEKPYNSIPPPCPTHGMWSGRMTSCVAVPAQKALRSIKKLDGEMSATDCPQKRILRFG